MKSLFLQVAIATCIPPLAAATYKNAFIVEFKESAQLSPETLNSQVHTSLATFGLDCTASTRYQFKHVVFQGSSFDLSCQNDHVAPNSILKALQSVDGVKKAWPVISVDIPIKRGQHSGAAEGRNIKQEEPISFQRRDPSPFDRRDPSPFDRRDPSPFDRRDGGAVDSLSTHIDTGVAKLHAANVTGSGIRIAVIDNGFQTDVPGLSKVDVAYAHDLAENDNDVSDNCHYHGTHVLGIMAAKGDEGRYGVIGVAPDATYELYRIQTCTTGTTTDLLIGAFLEAAERGVDIISCSFAGRPGFPEEPLSAVVTRLVRKGTYISLPTGNGGLGVFTSGSAATADAVTSVGSTDNSVTPLFTWQGSWTSKGDGGVFRFVRGEEFDVPSDASWTLWSPNQKPDVTNILSDACEPLPEPKNLPKDLSNAVVLISVYQCFTNSAGATVDITTLGIPNVIYYVPNYWTVSDGSGFYFGSPAKTVVTVEYETGVKLLEAFHKDPSTKVHLPNEPSRANLTLENRPNNRTGNLVSIYTSWGPTLTGGSMPIIMAPGGNILSTFPASYGGYGVISGTSMSVPFESGLAALVKQRHPEYTTADIQAVLATTARPMPWVDFFGKTYDFLAPVFQQGGGLPDAWKAVQSSTLLSEAALSFNDTANRPKELSFSIKNTGTTAITYRLSHRGAASGYVLRAKSRYRFTAGEANPVYADVSITPSVVKVEPGQSASVAVAIIKGPELPDAATRISFFGGYIAIEAEGSSEPDGLSLPYTGFGAPLALIPMINRDTSYLMAVNTKSLAKVRIEPNRTFVCSLDTTKDVPLSCSDNLLPAVWIDPVIPSRNMSISIVDAKSGRVAANVYQSTSDDTWGLADYWYWNGSDDNKAYIPEGSYIWRVKAQKLNADPSKDESFDVYDAGPWVLRYTTNSTGGA